MRSWHARYDALSLAHEWMIYLFVSKVNVEGAAEVS